MARRRGLSIALQTALGALSGAAGGYAQQEEMKRKRELEGKEAEERRALNLANLYRGGFKTAEQMAQQEEQMGMAGARLLSSMKGGTRVTDQDVNMLSQAATTKGRPAGRITYGGQELVLPETEQDREERLQSLSADRLRLAKEREVAAERSALDTVLSAYGNKIKPEDRPAIMTGRLTLAQALERGGRTTGPDVASIRRDINDKVAQFRSSVMRMEIDVPDPNRVGRTMKVRLKPEQQQQMIDEYRSGLEQDYGLRAARTTPRGGGTSAGGMDNIGTILDRTTAFGAEGPMSPMTWQSSSGKTYKFQ
jgi:hypothetical protein